jgi:hypothetical protein
MLIRLLIGFAKVEHEIIDISNLAKLLVGLYTPESGKIYLD